MAVPAVGQAWPGWAVTVIESAREFPDYVARSAGAGQLHSVEPAEPPPE